MTTWTLSSTTLTSLRMPCVILSASACAIRASSCVNLSNFFRALSRSAIPANFLRNFSVPDLVNLHTQLIRNSLADPRLNSFVAIPKILITSASISVIMFVIAVVGATSVYVSSRAKNHPMRSKSSARTPLLAATPWAVYKIFDMRSICRKQ